MQNATGSSSVTCELYWGQVLLQTELCSSQSTECQTPSVTVLGDGSLKWQSRLDEITGMGPNPIGLAGRRRHTRVYLHTRKAVWGKKARGHLPTRNQKPALLVRRSWISSLQHWKSKSVLLCQGGLRRAVCSGNTAGVGQTGLWRSTALSHNTHAATQKNPKNEY